MSDYKSRVVEEKLELDIRAQALSDFIGTNPIFFIGIGTSPIFPELSPTDQELMKEQCDVMWQYSEILGKRIASFG